MNLRERLARRQFGYPFLLSFLFVLNMTNSAEAVRPVRGVFIVLVLATAAWSSSRNTALRVAGGLLAVLTVVLPLSSQTGGVGGNLIGAIYTLFVTTLVLTDVLGHKRVTSRTLCGALSAYLLLALGWGLLFTALEKAAPGSFSGLPSDVSSHVHVFQYFSVVTLTTLGFGDITPQGSWAPSLVATEALVGQMFLVVLVARLVALQIVHQDEQEPPDEG